MKTQITRSNQRMHTEMGWLDSWHSFSFGGHLDPERMNFGPLRVVNDDTVAPNGGFGSHPHSDMEIISLVLDGELEHKDSMGNGRVIKTGDIQYMSAGSGVVHSEFNPSKEKPVHFMQIWIVPNAKGLEPRYADQPIIGTEPDSWKLLLSPDGRDGSMEIRQDVTLRSAEITPGIALSYSPEAGRGLWVFVIEGELETAGDVLNKGDSAAIEGLSELSVRNSGTEPAQVLLFDVPLEGATRLID
jgi:redox-sensitive bicupin YhaK (pirin superfamily)